MTENSTDWEALDKKYKDRYIEEKLVFDRERLLNEKKFPKWFKTK